MDAKTLYKLIADESVKSTAVCPADVLWDVAQALAPRLSLKRERKAPAKKRRTGGSPELKKVLEILLPPTPSKGRP